MKRINLNKIIILFALILLNVLSIKAQENYEVQVYTSPTLAKNTTIFELHSNISPSGPKNTVCPPNSVILLRKYIN